MDATSPSPPARTPARRLVLILAVWALVVGAALLVASALDSPVGAGARDEAQPAAPGEVAEPSNGLAEGLPPLALVLDRPLPADVRSLPPARQAQRLRAQAQSTGSARRYVELGSVLMGMGDEAGATAAFRSAQRAGGQDVAAETGLALVRATSGPDGPQVAAARLDALAAANPGDQVLAFNQGWLAIYRRDREAALTAWTRTIQIKPGTRLARAAMTLGASLGGGPSGRNP